MDASLGTIPPNLNHTRIIYLWYFITKIFNFITGFEVATNVNMGTGTGTGLYF